MAESAMSASPWVQMNDSLVGRIYGHFTGRDSSTETRVLIIIALTVVSHGLVRSIRRISEWLAVKSHAPKSPLGLAARRPKVVTLHRLVVSAIIFAIYFLALGLILQECGVNLTAYLASASVLGLAISFGSQGLVQDIVSGLTLIFLDTMDVGDMVEIAGTAVVSGRVEEIGLRYTKLVNFYNQRVMIPNRTIANVSRFPYGGVDAFADVWIPAGADRQKAAQVIAGVAAGMRTEFGEIILSEPGIGKVETAPGGNWSFVRVHFRIWPGQGGLIETTFRQQAVRAMKVFDPDYADWQVPVTYRASAMPQFVFTRQDGA
jgi:small conductance mechanosensitive channel